jgi:hypothetical protein
MKLVAKYSSPLISLGKLPQEADALLRRYWRDELSKAEEGKVVDLLKNLHGQGVWVECECCQDAKGEGPVLGFYRRRDGYFGMRRLTNRINHELSCVYHWDQIERRNREGAPDYLIFKAPHTRSPQSSTVIPFRQPGKPSQSGSNKLRELLMWLLNKAELNTLDGGSVKSEDRLRRLMDTARRIPLPGTDLFLNQILWTLPDAFVKRWAHVDLNKLQERGNWPENVPQQGYLIIPLKAIEGRILITSGDRRIEVHGKITSDGEKNCFPRIAMVSFRKTGIGLQAEDAFTVPVRYYAHVRKESGEVRHYFDLVPVRSEREREVGDELAAITRWKSGKGPDGEGVTVRRPIMKGEPDANYIVEAAGAKVYVLLDDEASQPDASLDERRQLLRDDLGEHDRVFVLMRDEDVEKLRVQLIGWLKAELGYA